MPLKEITLGIALLAAPLAAQTTPHKAAPATQSKSDESQRNELGNRIAALEKRVAALETSLEFYKVLIGQKQDKNDVVFLDPSSPGFFRLDSDTGTFLVSLKDASPYLNGYRVKLDIGNPSDAEFTNPKLKVRWGHPLKSISNYSEWQASLHEKEIDLTDNLEAGHWNHITIDLLPCGSDELGYFEVSLQTPIVVLYTGPAH